MIGILTMLAACIFSIFSGTVNAALEIDGMPLDIAEKEFVDLRSSAKVFRDEPNVSKDYLYVLPSGSTIEGATAVTSGRGFKSGKGCAAGVGFEFANVGELTMLINRIKSQYKLVHEGKRLGDGSQMKFFENELLFASIHMVNATEKDSYRATYSVSYKSCGENLARRWQTVPR